jgi:hypothetical protein
MLGVLGPIAVQTGVTASGLPSSASGSCPIPYSSIRNDSEPIGICPGDLRVIGGIPEIVHEGILPPTGIAVDPEHNIFFTYARNMEKQNYTLTKATSLREVSATLLPLRIPVFYVL